jgi:peroxiredoxin
MKQWVLLLTMMIGIRVANAQSLLQQGTWRAQLLREDGNHIVFNFEVGRDNKKTVLYILNAGERMKVDNIRVSKDSVWIQMPVFESGFRAKLTAGKQLEGVWTKESRKGIVQMPFTAVAQNKTRFPAALPPVHNITGRWAIHFIGEDKLNENAVGEFVQKGNILSGTMLTATGDYRYLGGVVNGDTLKLSTFDGMHAYFFTAKISSDQQLTEGHFYSGSTASLTWVATKNAQAAVPDVAAMYLKKGEERLNFSFSDLNKKMVAMHDQRFKNKVVIVQIMGSWCPNCMDETAFLSAFYNQNRQRGVEVVGLAYEYSTDFERAKKSVQKFKDRFGVQYPLLITGVAVGDSLRTEKTLPQLTRIQSFPSTIFIDKKGRVAKIHVGFEGPGTGMHYETLKKEYAETVERLLKE